jgi:hypothetical protein
LEIIIPPEDNPKMALDQNVMSKIAMKKYRKDMKKEKKIGLLATINEKLYQRMKTKVKQNV